MLARDDDARRDLFFSGLVFALALLPRLYVALAWAREPVWDGHYYDFGARQIASGFGYADQIRVGDELRWHPWCHYPVGYSALLALAYTFFGKGPHVAPLTNALLGALLAVVVHRLALRALSPARAAVAALLVAFSPELVTYTALLMTEPAASLAPLLAPLALLRYPDSRKGPALAGVALGLGTLVRPQTVLAAPLLALLFVDPANLRSSLKTAIARAGLATAVCLATVAPWTLRNCRVMDGCAFVSTNAGWNLFIGAFPRATGRFETVRATDGCPVVTGQVQQDRCWRDLGIAHIKQDPGRWLSLAPKKLSYTFDHSSFPMGYLGEANPTAWPEEEKAKGRKVLSWAHRLLMMAACFAPVARVGRARLREGRFQLALAAWLASLCIWMLTRDEPTPFWWLALVMPLLAAWPLPGGPPLGPLGRYLVALHLSAVVTHAVFFGEDRYHIFVTPVLCLLTAFALRSPEHPPQGSVGQASPSVA